MAKRIFALRRDLSTGWSRWQYIPYADRNYFRFGTSKWFLFWPSSQDVINSALHALGLRKVLSFRLTISRRPFQSGRYRLALSYNSSRNDGEVLTQYFRIHVRKRFLSRSLGLCVSTFEKAIGSRRTKGKFFVLIDKIEKQKEQKSR